MKSVKVNKHAAVFLDRDGTIIEDSGYIKDLSDLVFYPFSFEALHILQEEFLLFIITNQSGIAKGITTEHEVQMINRKLLELLEAQGIHITSLYYCPHQTEDQCICKKPSPYFIRKAASEYNLDLQHSYIIGDHPSDVSCGHNGGVTPLYVLTGHGIKHKEEIPVDTIICENVLIATEFITTGDRQKLTKQH